MSMLSGTMAPRREAEAAAGVAPYTITSETLDRVTIYGADGLPEKRGLAAPTDPASVTYTWTPDDHVSSVSGG